MSESKATFDYYDEAGSLLIDFNSRSKETTLKSDALVLITPSSDDDGIASIEILLDDKEVANKISEIIRTVE